MAHLVIKYIVIVIQSTLGLSRLNVAVLCKKKMRNKNIFDHATHTCVYKTTIIVIIIGLWNTIFYCFIIDDDSCCDSSANVRKEMGGGQYHLQGDEYDNTTRKQGDEVQYYYIVKSLFATQTRHNPRMWISGPKSVFSAYYPPLACSSQLIFPTSCRRYLNLLSTPLSSPVTSPVPPQDNQMKTLSKIYYII